MKTKITIIIATLFGVLLGIIITGVTLNLSAGDMIIKEMKSPYDFNKTVTTIVNNINTQPGWHVVAVIDQNQAVQTHGGFPIGNYDIIQYCNGRASAEMLSADDRKRIGAMLPKNLAVYEKSDGQVYVATSNGAVIGKLFGGKTGQLIEKVSLDVESILRFMNFKFNIF
ncbi:DUF302 domain-containing protein [Microbacter margulisiae]|uniref:Uncharacterized protein (DUF302 family) n=1 Tax=Microbacter margulisiae TaxID=1350067 RepID=A0A7W5DQE9_9PORP|nr:DUF302 domain-containing protein [Microbacter margulisiae]MBB3187167.1 uncharacterized protein (DUF302 family) [Microbacter margulisiae]